MLMITISAALMRENGFPGVELTMETAGTSLLAYTFPGGDDVVIMSGPPGGPSHFSIRVVRHGALDAIVRELFGAERYKLRMLGGEDLRLRVAGESRGAVAWTMQPTPWIDSRGAVLIPIAASEKSLLVQFSAIWEEGRGLVPDAGQAKVLQSLRVDGK